MTWRGLADEEVPLVERQIRNEFAVVPLPVSVLLT